MDIDWLNYHHLLYFWVVAREGGIVRASRRLLLAPPTLSGQIKLLERRIGEKLFVRHGRALALTDVGRLVLRYADDLFAVGQELIDVLKKRPTGGPLRLVVGVTDVVPKLVAYRLLEPALRAAGTTRVTCREDKTTPLLLALASHEVDVVIADAPAGPEVKVRAFSHLLGETAITALAVPALARRLRRRFPASLDGAPTLLPAEGTTLRRTLDQWYAGAGLAPRIAGEFDDSALLKVFGQAGAGVFFAPTVIAAEVARQYGVRPVGDLEGVRERFYALSVERRLRHPAVVALSSTARTDLFGPVRAAGERGARSARDVEAPGQPGA